MGPLFDRIQDWIDRGYYHGASLLLSQNGQPRIEKYWGNSNAATVEYIASAGKWLAAATILAAAEDGSFSLDDRLGAWLPEFKGQSGLATVRQMLAHTAGFAPYQPEGACPDNYQTLAESMAQLLPLPMEAAPGTTWNYGGLAFQAAGRIAEIATGQPWQVLFQERIAGPLHMSGTRFTPVDDAHGHHPMLGGGARGTLHDLANFVAMVAQGGEFQGKRILARRSVEVMLADGVGSALIPMDNFVAQARSSEHHGIYGLGVWRERLDSSGRAVLVSSPSWAGTYPWIDKLHNICGVFLAHVAGSASGFTPMLASAELPDLAAQYCG